MESAERHVEIGGVRTYVRTAGAGSPVMLLHGLGASSYSWRNIWPVLAEKHTVHMVDWPGHGRSGKDADFDYSPRGYSRWLVAAMDKLGVARADLVGNSLGGIISLLTAIESPEKVGKLVLIGAPTYPDSRPQFLWTLRWPVIGPLFERLLGPWAIAYCAKQVYTEPSVVTPELLETYGAPLRTVEGRRAIATFVRNALPDDAPALVKRYRDVAHPTLILWGDRDCMVGRGDAERLAMDLPNSRLVRLNGAGHAPQEDRPDEILAHLHEFLAA